MNLQQMLQFDQATVQFTCCKQSQQIEIVQNWQTFLTIIHCWIKCSVCSMQCAIFSVKLCTSSVLKVLGIVCTTLDGLSVDSNLMSGVGRGVASNSKPCSVICNHLTYKTPMHSGRVATPALDMHEVFHAYFHGQTLSYIFSWMKTFVGIFIQRGQRYQETIW